MLLDVTGAFLYGAVKRDVAVCLPAEMGQRRAVVGVLNKSLYGLRDAPQIWSEHLGNTLRNLNFEESPTVPGVFRHKEKRMILAAHVDDVICSGSAADLEWLTVGMQREYAVKTVILGPGHQSEGQFLKRTIKWTARGLEWSADSNHQVSLTADLEHCEW